jgi:HSP20 family molecular chaperone IbpA
MSRDIEHVLDMWLDLLEQISPRRGIIPTMAARKPDVDVEEHNGTISITIELAGFGKDDVELEVSSNKVNIKAKNEKKDYDWSRKFEGLDPESVSATMSNGILDVVIEKKEKTSAKRVDIQ